MTDARDVGDEEQAQAWVSDTDRPGRLYESCCSWVGSDHKGWSESQMRSALEEAYLAGLREGRRLENEAIVALLERTDSAISHVSVSSVYVESIRGALSELIPAIRSRSEARP